MLKQMRLDNGTSFDYAYSHVNARNTEFAFDPNEVGHPSSLATCPLVLAGVAGVVICPSLCNFTPRLSQLLHFWNPFVQVTIFLPERGHPDSGMVRKGSTGHWMACMGGLHGAACFWNAALHTAPISIGPIMAAVPTLQRCRCGPLCATHRMCAPTAPCPSSSTPMVGVEGLFRNFTSQVLQSTEPERGS